MLSEQFKRNITGKFKDIITYDDGTVVETEWDNNCIISNIGKLIASLFKGQAGESRLSYWAVGTGSDAWDDTTPPVATASDTGCLNETGRKVILPENISFIDGSGNVTASITNILQIQVTFGTTDCNSVWREFSIYGGSASTTLNSGTAINHKNHGVLTKTSAMTVQRQIRFTFN